MFPYIQYTLYTNIGVVYSFVNNFAAIAPGDRQVASCLLVEDEVLGT